ncbi:MAG: sigma-70 family RNA polymerase sigma factor [Candidatus Vogelbacteria bacterium]|nr:sigma-70 family RNA polymerase sigma factor [Candidatus Vogelbacteria bacterium]
MDLTDEQLVGDYLAGNEAALDRLIGRYLSPVYSFVLRFLAEADLAAEITQETFVKAWSNLARFDQTRKFKTWIFQIAKNTAYDYLKKKKPLLFSRLTKISDEEGDELDFESSLADPLPLADELADRRISRENLLAAIEKLGPEYRSVMFLRLNEQLEFSEIATVLDRPVNTVKSQYRRAVTRLREMFGPGD